MIVVLSFFLKKFIDPSCENSRGLSEQTDKLFSCRLFERATIVRLFSFNVRLMHEKEARECVNGREERE